MKLNELFNTIRLFIEEKIGGEELEAVFNAYRMRYYDYDKINKIEPKLAAALEDFNEDISNFEPTEKLRLEHDRFFIDVAELRKRAKKVVSLYDSLKDNISHQL